MMTPQAETSTATRDVVVALDLPAPDAALGLVDRLGAAAAFYKVGLELFTRGGPQVVRELRGRGKRVFLDLKLHDIPNTVAAAARAAAELGVELLTVHALGGPRMVAAAVEGAGASTRILAVTLLTSHSDEEAAALLGRESAVDPEAEVLRLARSAVDAGAAGVVSSPNEVAALRALLGPDALLVTPGIRLPGDDAHDQRRVATPAHAIAAGADLIVVGRSITGAPDPASAFRAVSAAMEAR